ncbi:imidazoleglycerol-phosphate dehydratase HisB [bacterium]|nr:imidazoleglycerol-phosphate dehydratase HisB [bacterium]
MREAIENRNTKETEVFVKINLDGNGVYNIDTGIKFFNHMLEQFACHSGFDVEIKANSLDGNNHHCVEDVGITLGRAFLKALGDKKGIKRYGEKALPLDEALVMTCVDISGRAFSKTSLDLKDERTDDFETVLVPHFFMSFAQNALITLHIRMLDGFNTHHIIEAAFKSFARSLREAVKISDKENDRIPSTKGII